MLAFQHTWWRLNLASHTQSWLAGTFESLTKDLAVL